MGLIRFIPSLLIYGAGAALSLVASSAFSSEGGFTSEDLARLIESRGLGTIEEVVSALPPELASESTFVARSQSMQQSSPSAPRVISWSAPGGFALTINGDPSHRGFNTIEAFQFSRAEGRFHFLSLKFPLPRDSRGAVRAIFTEPASCKTCHGENPRPIWGEYPTWKSAFGSTDDFMKSAEEAGSFRSFVEAARGSPRYAPFLPQAPTRPFFPFREDLGPGLENLSTSMSYRPNLRLGAFLARLNSHRVARAVLGSGVGAKAALASFMGCPGAEGFEELIGRAGLRKQDIDFRAIHDDPANAALDPVLSYFDGTATERELVAARILEALGSEDASVDVDEWTRQLSEKYVSETAPNQLDAPVFEALDAWGGWISIPYAASEITRLQKREPMRGGFLRKYHDICAYALATGVSP